LGFETKVKTIFSSKKTVTFYDFLRKQKLLLLFTIVLDYHLSPPIGNYD